MSLSDALHSVLEDLWNCFRTMLKASLNATYQPVKMMAHLVAENPQWQDLEARFPSWADLALKM
ncbi:hypothetical protein QJQ45_021877, partial [Haematococcus lacustris]